MCPDRLLQFCHLPTEQHNKLFPVTKSNDSLPQHRTSVTALSCNFSAGISASCKAERTLAVHAHQLRPGTNPHSRSRHAESQAPCSAPQNPLVNCSNSSEPRHPASPTTSRRYTACKGSQPPPYLRLSFAGSKMSKYSPPPLIFYILRQRQEIYVLYYPVCTMYLINTFEFFRYQKTT